MRAIKVNLVLFIMIISFSFKGGRDSFGGKHEFSLMDVASASVINSSEVQIIKKDEHHFCVVPQSDRHIWIMLNPQFEPFYKQMPKGSYVLSKEDFLKIQSSGLASGTVLAVLESHIEVR